MDSEYFTYEKHDVNMTVLGVVPEENMETVCYKIKGNEHLARQSGYTCAAYMFETDGEGNIISMEALEGLDGELAGLYSAE